MGRKIGPPTALISEVISEPPLPSKGTNRLRPTFVDVKAKILNLLARCERVKWKSAVGKISYRNLRGHDQQPQDFIFVPNDLIGKREMSAKLIHWGDEKVVHTVNFCNSDRQG
ncbi:hypothetical protein AVEN_178410-1 [Araneus ventricosus]|uniref:Uncharacterized protein n=1 Tax=Araneus ventricosus TaxID=182803 RepID=A0A4Y2BDC9_ARAVE|nr:hypothetical protein AVEN_178410-1 [Araneus ventricosus]